MPLCQAEEEASCVNQYSPEKQNRYPEIQRKIDYEGLAYEIMEAEKSHDLPRKAGGVVPV